nr:hypothetical protein [Tanacetum cinerariifolium]
MSADSAVTFSSVHSEVRSWSIPSEDPYEEAAQQLFEQAPHPPEYVPRDHVPVFVLEFEHPEDLVSAEGEAPTSLLPPGFLSPRIRPLSPRGHHHYYLYLPPSTSRRDRIPEANTPPHNRPLLATPRPGCEVEESSAAAVKRQGPAMAHGVEVCTRESSEFCTRHHDAQKDCTAVRAEIEVLKNERLAYKQDVLETHARCLEWQHQAADDFTVEHIMRTQALEAGAHIGTLEDAGSSS